MGAAPINEGAAVYDAVLHRRQALMGASGARALVKNFRVFAIASFACIGGVLYGYNQGMFSGVLAMPAFKERKWAQEATLCETPKIGVQQLIV
jgi:hypothetical protein